MALLKTSSSALSILRYCFVLVWSLWSCGYTFVAVAALNPQSQLKVLFPPSLMNGQQNYDHTTASFGAPPSGGSITGPLYYVDSDLCNPSSNTGAMLTNGIYHPTPPFASGSPFLLMINRGGCTFVKKVRNAQHMGSAGVLIADNVCLCNNTECRLQTSSPTCEDIEPSISDDGTGSDVSIPSFLVSKHHADLFKQTILKSNQTMRVEMYFVAPSFSMLPEHDSETPGQDMIVVVNDSELMDQWSKRKISLEFWMSPADAVSMQFLIHFRPIVVALKRHLDFTPHMYLINGTKSGCDKQLPEQFDDEARNEQNSGIVDQSLPCYDLCTNQGRYCAPDPDGSMHSGTSGAMVVEEALRQLCIWSLPQQRQSKKEFDNVDLGGNLWWNYILAYYDDTYHVETPLKIIKNDDEYLTFVMDIINLVGIDQHALNRCVIDSGGFDQQDSINNKLEREIALQSSQQIYRLPMLRMSGVPVASLTVGTVLSTICQQLLQDKYNRLDNSVMDICTDECFSCHDVGSCVAYRGHCAFISSIELPTTSAGNKKGSAEAALNRPQSTNCHHTNTTKSAAHAFAAHSNTTNDPGVSHFVFGTSILSISLVAVVVAFVYHQRSRQETRERVRAIMADYMPVDDDTDLQSFFTQHTGGRTQPP